MILVFPLPVYGERVRMRGTRMRKAKRKQVRIRRTLRPNSTDAEMKLWLALRARRLGGFKFIRQAKIGRYVVDFVCRERSVVVEVDGGQHAENKQEKIRDAVLMSKGYCVLRYWNSDVLKNIDGVLERLYTELCAR
jgi:very-short-patch-repair endonuclease